MSEYISRETAYQFFKDQLEKETGAYSKGRNAGLRIAMSAVMNNDALPAANVRSVVLCRDCKWWTKQEESLQGRCDLLQIYPTGTWFCANGKREES